MMTKPNGNGGRSMTGDNVVALASPSEPLPLVACELRLIESTCNLLMTVADEHGSETQLEFTLASSPPGFSLDLLRRAWRRWRNGTFVGGGKVSCDEA